MASKGQKTQKSTKFIKRPGAEDPEEVSESEADTNSIASDDDDVPPPPAAKPSRVQRTQKMAQVCNVFIMF